MTPASSALWRADHGAQLAEVDPARDVIARDALHRAVQVDRLVVPGRTNERDDALRLAERIGADQMRALGKQFDRAQQLGDLARRVAVAEHRQPERRLGDEGIALRPARTARRSDRAHPCSRPTRPRACRWRRRRSAPSRAHARLREMTHRPCRASAFRHSRSPAWSQRNSPRSAGASCRAFPAWRAPRRGPGAHGPNGRA